VPLAKTSPTIGADNAPRIVPAFRGILIPAPAAGQITNFISSASTSNALIPSRCIIEATEIGAARARVQSRERHKRAAPDPRCAKFFIARNKQSRGFFFLFCPPPTALLPHFRAKSRIELGSASRDARSRCRAPRSPFDIIALHVPRSFLAPPLSLSLSLSLSFSPFLSPSQFL